MRSSVGGGVDAGALTPVVALLGTLLYRYRQRRWRRLAVRLLQGSSAG